MRKISFHGLTKVRLEKLLGSRLDGARVLRTASGLDLRLSKYVVKRLPYTLGVHKLLIPELKKYFQLEEVS